MALFYLPSIRYVILKNFKILRNDPETKQIFSLPPLIFFKRNKNLDNFLVRSAFKSNQEPSHVNAHDATIVPLFPRQLRSQDPIDPPNSLTTLHASL